MLNVHILKKLAHFTIDVEFTIGNEIIVLFGPSGSGKTTILNAIAGIVKMDEGQVILNGKYFVENGKSLVPVQQRKIGYVFQDYALFPHKTVWENIAYAMKNEKFARDLMDKLQITHLQHQYPHEISGGEKQRVALIRALATEPNLLLLDEPFSALDEGTRKKSFEQLKEIHQLWNIPIILVTHQRSDIEALADRLYRVEKGILLDGK